MNNIIAKQNNQIEIQKYIDKFLNFIDVSPKTVETYKVALKQFVAYIYNNNIYDITREDVISYREYLKESHKPTTVNSYMIAVRNLYSWLEYEEITKDITKKIKGVKLEQRHLKRGLSQEEIKQVLNICSNKREEVLIKLMIICALRCNEVVNIKLEDFYKDNGFIMLKIQGKGRDGLKQDIVKVDNRVYELINDYIKEYGVKDYLFVSTSNNNTNGGLTTKTIRLIVTNLFKRANLDMNMLSAHSTRHTSVELALSSGMSIQEVSECVRHRSIVTTTIYAKEINKRESLFANKLADAIF